jgi:alpha-N-arabinofuranosidase
MDGTAIPQISAGASVDDKGMLLLSLCNLHHADGATVKCALSGAKGSNVTGRIVTARAINTHNTFDAPDQVKAATFDGAKLSGETLTVALPARSVVLLEMQS